jgi:hypothetical protein
MATVRRLTCCVCDEDAGTHEQHWNRDTGFGICASCVAWVRSRGETEAEIRDLYGVEGKNFAAKEQRP